MFYKPSREQSGDSKPRDHVAIFILALFIVLIMPYNTHRAEVCGGLTCSASENNFIQTHVL